MLLTSGQVVVAYLTGEVLVVIFIQPWYEHITVDYSRAPGLLPTTTILVANRTARGAKIFQGRNAKCSASRASQTELELKLDSQPWKISSLSLRFLEVVGILQVTCRGNRRFNLEKIGRSSPSNRKKLEVAQMPVMGYVKHSKPLRFTNF